MNKSKKMSVVGILAIIFLSIGVSSPLLGLIIGLCIMAGQAGGILFFLSLFMCVPFLSVGGILGIVSLVIHDSKKRKKIN